MLMREGNASLVGCYVAKNRADDRHCSLLKRRCRSLWSYPSPSTRFQEFGNVVDRSAGDRAPIDETGWSTRSAPSGAASARCPFRRPADVSARTRLILPTGPAPSAQQDTRSISLSLATLPPL